MLRQAQLEIAEQNRRLVEMDKEKTELLSLTAHDLQNPLSAIHGVAEALHTESHSVEIVSGQHVHQLSGMILETSKRMFEMIVKILSADALETGKFSVEAVSFEINFIITSVIDRFEQIALIKNITITSVLPDKPLTVIADQQATIEILENLLSNAIKYSPPGKRIEVHLTSKKMLPANLIMTREDWKIAQSNVSDSFTESCVRIEVKDEGPGLTEEDKTLLFTKFAKLSAQPTAGEQSIGLGLSIVKYLTEAMNGRIWCESEYGKGASFIVELPSTKKD